MPATLAQLRHLIALADHGSFTAAARSSHRSQAAFSRSIAELERSIGALLVDRIGHTNELTPLGRVVLDHARHVVADTEALERAVKVRTHSGTDSLKLGMSATPLALLSAPLLIHAARSREMRASVSGGAIPLLLQALRERRLDALIVETSAVPAGTDLVVEAIARLPTGFLCRSGHPLAGRRRIPAEALFAYPIASTGISEQMARAMVERFGVDAHPERLVTLCCESIASLYEVVGATDAVYMGVLSRTRAGMKGNDLVRLRIDTAGFESSFGLVRLARRTEPLMLPELRNLAAEVFRPRPGTASSTT